MTPELKLTTDNLFSNGYILEYQDGTISLERNPVVYSELPQDTPYTIKQGDSLTTLAWEKYGNSKLWHVIADANPQIIDIFNLEVGLDIRLPFLGNTEEIYD